MESSCVSRVLESIQTDYDKLSEKLEIFVEPQPEKADRFKQLNEILYCRAVNNTKHCKGKFLPKLHIDGFDTEQIWQQCDLLNKAALPNIPQTFHSIDSKSIHHAISENNEAPLPSTDADKSGNDDFSDAESNGKEKYAFDGDSYSPTEMEPIISKKPSVKGKKKSVDTFGDDSDSPTKLEAVVCKKTKRQNDFSDTESNGEEYAFDDDDSNSPTELEEIIKKNPAVKGKKKSDNVFSDDSDSPTEMEMLVRKKPLGKEKKKFSSSQVDDQFFKLSEMEEFLNVEDLKVAKKIEKNNDIMFQDIPSDSGEDSDEEEGIKPLKSSKDIMYADFFDAHESEGNGSDGNMDDYDESMMEENDDFLENDSAVEMKDDLEEKDNSEAESAKSDENKNVRKTAFELEQEKIRKKIQEYEKSMVEPLPWHLTGEVDATSRPIDSLIHKDTDFDSNVREDLTIDKVLTENIEQIVRMAIMNKAFNDVERKYKPTAELMAYKKEKALEQTKSKKSLAEVYEEDYLKKQSKKNEEEEDPKHKEIQNLMDSVFPQLYSLFSHIPVPAVPDIKIVSNLPAVMLEEVAPITMNDSTLLAPQEVKKKSGQIKGHTERTDTDRKRERRMKKLHQKRKEKKRLEKLESQKGNPSAKVTKLEKLQTLKKLKQHKNTKIATLDDIGKIKSSKDFFSRLQDTMDIKTRTKSQNFSKKKKK